MNQLDLFGRRYSPPLLDDGIPGFAVLDSNRHAFCDVLRWHRRPPDLGNPVLIVGPRGTGKTHLARAALQMARMDGARVECLSAAELADRYLRGLIGGSTESFRNYHRRYLDALIVEHLEKLDGRRAFLEEVRHTLNALLDSGRPVLVTLTQARRERRRLLVWWRESFPGSRIARIPRSVAADRRSRVPDRLSSLA